MSALVKEVKRIDWFDDRYYRIIRTDGSVEYYPSVTTLLEAVPKPFLAKWRGNVGNREADMIMHDASERGTRVHHACTLYATGGVVLFQEPKWKHPDPLLVEQNERIISQAVVKGLDYIVLGDQSEMVQVERFAKWIDVVKPEIIMAEGTVYSERARYAGTLDYLFNIKPGSYMIAGEKSVMLEGGLYVTDLKTGNFDDSYFLQTAAYANAVMAMTGKEIIGTMIIHTSAQTRTGIVGLKTYVRTEADVPKDYANFQSVQSVWMWRHEGEGPKVEDFPSVLMRSDLEEKIETGFTKEIDQRPAQTEPASAEGESGEPQEGSTIDPALAAVLNTKKKNGRSK